MGTKKNISAARVALGESRAALRDCVLGRNEEIDGLLAALIAEQNIVLLGVPGTAKSMLSRRLAELLGTSAYFELLMSKYTTPDALFGPLSLTALQQDQYRRVSTGYLPEAEVAFLDEVFKAGDAVLNSLLTALNERVWHDDGQAKAMKLECVVAASNEMPSSDALDALWDRFALRYWVEPLRGRHARLGLLSMAASKSFPGKLPPKLAGHLSELRSLAASLEVPGSVLDSMLTIRQQLENEGIVYGDRRWVIAIRTVSAYALVQGASRVTGAHLDILRHMLWAKPEQRDIVGKIVGEAASPELTEARELHDAVIVSTEDMLGVEISASNLDTAATRVQKALTNLATTREKLSAIGQKVKASGDDATLAQVRDYYAAVKQRHETLRRRLTDAIADLSDDSSEVF